MSLLLTSQAAQSYPEVVTQMLLVIGVVAIGVLLTVSIRGKISRRNDERPDPRERLAHAKTRQRITDDKNAATAELHDTVRHYAAMMDNKAERLEQLIVEAERKIAELRELLAGMPDDDLDDAARKAAREAEQIAGEIDRQLSDEPSPDHDDGNRSPAPEPAHVGGRALDPLTRSVYELADAGHDAVSIAQVLDEQIGKVELILALRER